MLKSDPVPAVIIKPASNHPLRRQLALAINGPEFVADLLLQRGVEEKEQAREFFLAPLRPDPVDAKPMLGLDKAVALLLDARRKGDKVIVHGDYDADGVTATALLYQGLKWCGFNADWFLPNRFEEGYGITFASVDKLHARGARWMVSVDTGIAAAAEVARARELGIGVILTDHHQAEGELPPADAILNPNQPGCPYPNKGLAGVGVAYKLLNALSLNLLGQSADRYLDLVALGSLADNAPLSGENRRLVKAGLKLLDSSSNLGIRALLEHAGVESPVASGELLFKVTPLLNAMGRMGSPEISLKLLLSENREEAARCLERMTSENDRRRKLDQAVTAAAIGMVEDNSSHSDSGCLVLSSTEWHEGVIGIAAARLVERFRRPCFILAIDASGLAKGSGRTIAGFHLHKALGGAAHLLEKWGGHYYAAGFSIRAENIEAFRALMNRTAAEHLAGNDFVSKVNPAVEITLDQLNEESLLWIRRFEPFGPLNEAPLFYSENVDLSESPRIVGEKHLKLKVGSDKASFDAIGFNLGYMQARLAGRSKLDKLAYFPEWNSFRGIRRIQLRITALE